MSQAGVTRGPGAPRPVKQKMWWVGGAAGEAGAAYRLSSVCRLLPLGVLAGRKERLAVRPAAVHQLLVIVRLVLVRRTCRRETG